MVVGIAMVLMGVVTLMRGPRAESGRGASWLNSIGSFGIVPVFGVALALNVRPKAVLLVAAAGLAISRAGLAFEQNLLLVVFYTALATFTVVVPIVATILFPRWMEPRLVAVKGWIAASLRRGQRRDHDLVGAFVIAVGLGIVG